MSSATELHCSESKQQGEWAHHLTPVLNQSSEVGALPQQQSPRSYKISLQKLPIRFSNAKCTPPRGDLAVGMCQGTGSKQSRSRTAMCS